MTHGGRVTDRRVGEKALQQADSQLQPYFFFSLVMLFCLSADLCQYLDRAGQVFEEKSQLTHLDLLSIDPVRGRICQNA